MGLLDKITMAMPKNTVRVEIEQFTNQYGPYMSVDLFFDLLDQGLTKTHTTIQRDLYETIVTEKERMDKFNEALSKAAGLNNKGMALEKEGKIDEAIEVYEQNIGDCYQTTHPYNRLVILYRKKKDYDNEIRVIDIALQYLCVRQPNEAERFTKRKQKAMLLKLLSLESNENNV